MPDIYGSSVMAVEQKVIISLGENNGSLYFNLIL